jgi:cytoskeleton-associated protein 5
MSLDDRLASKQWKARVSAYEELVKVFEKSPSESAPVFKPYTRNPDLVKAMVTDSNAVAQEKALEAVKAFLVFGGKPAGQTRESVVPSLMDKCIGAMRSGTKKAAIEIVALYAEVEDIVGCEALLADVIRTLSAKQPKVVAGSVSALTVLVGEFGPKQVTFKPVLKKLPDLFAHADKIVRAESALLAQELHKWIGAALEPTLSVLKEIQAKELREQFAQLDASGQRRSSPTRFLSSQRPTQDLEADAIPGLPSATGLPSGASEAAVEEVDTFEFLEPSDPLKDKAWPDNFDEMISSAKWLERKEVLDQCIKVLERTPRIIYSMPIDSLVDVLCEKVKRDANINVVLSACICIQKFATGLRSDFAKNKDKALPALLEKCKERKESTVKVLADTLDAVFQTVSFGDIVEQTLNATKHKNPQVKTGAIQFLARCLRETKIMPGKGDIKPVAEALVAAMADGSGDVREAGAQGLGTLMKLIGERAMNQYIDSLDDIKKAKIQEQFKEATVKVKSGGGTPALPKSTKPIAPIAGALASSGSQAHARPLMAAAPAIKKAVPSARPVSAATAPSTSTAGPPARSSNAARPAVSTSRSVANTQPSRPAAAANKAAPVARSGINSKAAAATEAVKYRFQPEDAEAKAAELVPAHIQEELTTTVWKDRLAAMEKFNEWLKVECEGVDSEVVARFLSKRPGWKESNFQVMAEVYKALRMLAIDCPSFGRPTIAISITPLCDKLGDIKLKGPSGETLTTFAEQTSLGFVMHQALTPLTALKAPKAIADSLLWVNQALLDFGTSNVDVKGLVAYILTCLKSANASVRTNATMVIGTLSRFLGSALVNLLGDINPQLRATVESEIDKASSDPAPAPTRFAKELRPKESDALSNEMVASTAVGPSQEDEDALDALIPRVDLDNMVSSASIARIGDSNWKERKEGLEEVNAILDANTRLKPKLGDLATALKLRCADNNIQVRTLALDAIGKIATNMGRGFEAFVRTFIPAVTQVLADAKAPVRASASKTLTAMAQQTGVAPMTAGFTSVLDSKVANPTLRQDLFTWLGEWLEAHPPDKTVELNGLALPAIICLDDKLAAVRKAALNLLPFIVLRAGYKYVMEQTSALKAASRNTVIPLIDAARAQASSKAPPPPPPSTGVTARLGGTATAPPSMTGAVRRKPDGSSSVATPSAARTATAVARSLKAPSSGAASALSDAATADSTNGTARLPRIVSKRPGAGAASSGGIQRTGSSSSGNANTPLVEKCAPFMNDDLKFKALREKRENGRGGAYWIGADAAPRADLVDTLRQQCESQMSAGMIDSMFSKDHNAERDYMAALSLLNDFFAHPESAMEEYQVDQSRAVSMSVAHCDLIFKYTAIRLTDNNTSTALKCLDVLASLISLLRGQEYHMSDYEANAILPCIIAKFGDPKVAFRDRIRTDILRKITYIYPPSKILTHYVEEGLVSKNVRVRTECLGELGHLFYKYGAQVCSLPKTLPLIARQISDRDGGVRTAALLAIGELYKVIGSDVWKYVGSIPAKDSSLLEERLKRTTGPTGQSTSTAATKAPIVATTPATVEASAPPSALPSLRAQTSRASMATNSGIAQPQSRLAVPSRLARPTGSSTGSLAGPTSVRSRLVPPSAVARPGQIAQRTTVLATQTNGSASIGPTRPTPLQEPREEVRSVVPLNTGKPALARLSSPARPALNSEEDLVTEQSINEILSSDNDCSVAALKKIEQEINNVAPPLTRHADQLAIAFGKQLHRAFNVERGSATNERLKKHLLITGTSIFDNTRLWDDATGEGASRTLGSFVARSALVSLLTVLLQQLIDTKGATDEETQTHGRYLNIIVLRSFSSCNLNVLFGACLQMLTEATEDLEELQRVNEAALDKRIKFADLICKCIWKMTRKLNVSLQDELIDATILLQDLERFLQAIPPNVWKQRAAQGTPLGDMPLRTVKVIVTHIGSVFGEDSLDLLDGIPEPEKSYVYAHLLKVCDRSGAGASSGGVPGDTAALADQPIGTPLTPPSPLRQIPLSRTTSNASLAAVPTSPSSISSAARSAARKSGEGLSNADENDALVNAELRQIFDRIANKAESRAAIRDLYLFQRRYPNKEGSILRSLEQTGPIFQKFIRRALANHAAEFGEPSPFGGILDEASTRRDSVLSSPAGLGHSSARNSMAVSDWQQQTGFTRHSYLSPSSSRTNLAAFSPGTAGGAATWSTPSKGNGHYVSTPTAPNSAMQSRLSAGRHSPLPGSPSTNRTSINEDRLAQLRAKFARSTSGQSEASS